MKIIVVLLLITMPILLQAQKNKKANDTTVSITSEAMKESKALFIVDGRVQPNDSLINLDSMNPDNIENINVLKGEQAILQYGEAGKDGVILVTTKTPFKMEPLYIIDGLKTKTIFISPDDIESMRVLKGKENTSLYGAEGDAGVILITTKKTKKQN